MPNTIEQNLDRLVKARADIAKAIKAKGGTVTSGDGLEEFAADISTIAPYEMTGELPLVFKSDGESLRDYAVYGKNIRTANVWDEEWEVGGISSSGNPYSDSLLVRSKNYIPVTANTEYYFCSPTTTGIRIAFYGSSENFIGTSTLFNRKFTTDTNTKYIKFHLEIDNIDHDISINYPATVTTYEPYYDGIGERTANLLLPNIIYDVSDWRQVKIEGLEPSTEYTMSANIPVNSKSELQLYFYQESGHASYNNQVLDVQTSTLTTQADGTAFIQFKNTGVNDSFSNYQIMLNAGSTALPYEPYGYKIPITCGNSTTNLYTPDKLYEGDTLTYAETGADIPTVDGVNLIDSTLEVKLSMFIEYGDNEEVNE